MDTKALLLAITLITFIFYHQVEADLIWHNDEIPYEPKAKCRRGHSFYTNNKNANDTDIDVSSDIESLLDYANHDICMYCVCAVHGREVDCINRDVWFCHYYRYLRQKDSGRDRYSRLFQQDRPTYFRHFPWRLRRTMDEGIYDLEETVGSTFKSDKCIPFVSEYSDCSDDNLCSGCKKCVCVRNGEWSCEDFKQCPGDEDYNILDEQSIDDALERIERGLQDKLRREKKDPKSPLVPAPRKKTDDALLDVDDFYNGNDNIDAQLVKLLTLRKKRSVGTETNKTADKIKFYHTVDEIDEDILKIDNRSGTINAKKFLNLPKASRRTDVLDNDSLHIDFSEPKVNDPHITDNKIDISSHSEDKYVQQENDKINALVGNHTMKQKDKELSKLIVNELKNGSEVIGDRDAPIMSNITFTSENDTLTAMAFIAGNLLNQLWNMEKDSSEELKETEDLKQEKIADLLDLFKEPLNIRQENFLKNALEQLSVAIDKDKVLKNVTLCDKIEESRRLIEDWNRASDEIIKENVSGEPENTDVVKEAIETKSKATSQALSKIGDVLSLIEKFQQVHKTLNDLKQTDKQEIKPNAKIINNKPKGTLVLTNDETVSLNVFGKILEKITKLLLPHKKNKKVVKTIKNHHLFAKTSDVAPKIKSQYGIDIGNLSLTAKDKMVLDYLNTVKKHPNCIFQSAHDESKSFSNVEGDILLNLSEFFKIKTYMDLLKLLESGKKSTRSSNGQGKIPEEVTTLSTTTTSEVPTTTTNSNKLAQTKERLKDHIKSIIDDLKELQTAKGFPTSNISIADTLPCIYNILNADKETQHKLFKKDKITPSEKISSIFGSLKRDLLIVPTRRTNVMTEPRPKSAVVWERIVKSFDGKNKKITRRTMNNKVPKSFDEIKKMIRVLEQPSKTYKNTILVKGVQPAKRLALLKTLNEETRKYIETLQDIRYSVSSLKQLPLDKQNDLKDFIYNAAMNINLNSRVVKNSNKFVPDRNIKGDVEIIRPTKEKVLKEYSAKKQPMRSFNAPAPNKSVQLTRDEIINQLIKNRMQAYIKAKELKRRDLTNDINYAIAKKILNYLEMGNYNLARELYKYIVSQKEEARDFSREYTTVSPANKSIYGFPKVPLLQFEEPTTQKQWSGRNSWLKQLMNLKKI